MLGILMLIGLISFIAGGVGLIVPRWIRLSSRWQAAILMIFSLIPMTAAGEFFPDGDARQEPGTTLGLSISLAMVVAVVIFARVGMRAWAIDKRRSVNEMPGFVDRMARKWAAAMPAIKQRAEGNVAREAEPKSRRYSAEEVEDRRRAGEAFIRSLGERRKDKPTLEPNQASNAFGSDDYFGEVGDEGEHGRIIRTGWDQDPLMFEYVSYHGEVTARTLHKWVEYPRHVQGWCESARDTRTFRKERVEEWLCGTDAMLKAPRGRGKLY